MAASKSKKNKNTKSRKSQQDNDQGIDERFSAALNRPQFARVKEHTNKVVLDDRFASVLTDPRFQLQERDKYGRKKSKKGHVVDAHNELEAFYTVEKEEHKEGGTNNNDELSSNDDEKGEIPEVDDESTDEDEDPASRIAYLSALSRGELDVSSSSEEDASSANESDQDSDTEEDSVKGKSGVLDPSSKEEEELLITEVASPFIAVMNMDWSHVRAVDLFAILSSFTPPGSVKKVQIFPSDFGIKQMTKDATHGPVDIWKRTTSAHNDKELSDDDDEQSGDEESDSGGDDDEIENEPAIKMKIQAGVIESDFDPEKLRAYEASKLKYYFAIVEFKSSQIADMAYKEVDGLELEHSSAAMDLRSIDPDQLSSVIEGRKIRDEANSLPSKYEPPEFVVDALQQTNVTCTWEDEDTEREKKLTRYTQQQDWGAMAEGEDLKAYLASDNSSAGSDDESSDGEQKGKGETKGSRMRKMLGLDSDDEDEDEDDGISSNDDDDDPPEGSGERTATFTPGKQNLEEKIRSKLQAKEVEELTPWEKYQQKRKDKRREKRQAVRSRRGGKVDNPMDDGMYDEDQEFGPASFCDDDADNHDDFFTDENTKKESKAKSSNGKREGNLNQSEERAPSTQAELELLLAGDDDEELTKDYDMRGIIRMDKNKGKKLKGARKRKEAALVANTSGGDFKIDIKDDRFAAVLQGTDDRFGIDKTDSNYKDTEAMRKILSEQTKQRQVRKKAKVSHIVADVSAESATNHSNSGASALSALVKSLKFKVATKSQQ